MFDYDQGIAKVAHLAQGGDQSPLSRWCNPMLGSSSTYKTPLSCEPI
jgi:hypothetical protein